MVQYRGRKGCLPNSYLNLVCEVLDDERLRNVPFGNFVEARDFNQELRKRHLPQLKLIKIPFATPIKRYFSFYYLGFNLLIYSLLFIRFQYALNHPGKYLVILKCHHCVAMDTEEMVLMDPDIQFFRQVPIHGEDWEYYKEYLDLEFQYQTNEIWQILFE